LESPLSYTSVQGHESNQIAVTATGCSNRSTTVLEEIDERWRGVTMLISKDRDVGFRIPILVFSLTGHVVALLITQLGKNYLDLNPNWYEQFLYLWIPMVILSFALIIPKRNEHILTLLAVRFIFFLMIGLTAGPYKEIELILLCTLVVEAGLYLTYPGSVYVSGAMIVLSLLSQRSIEVWRQQVETITVHDLIAYSFYSILILTCVTIIKTLLIRHETNTSLIRNLDESVKQLSAANVDFQQYVILAEKQSAIEERNRITREIHDIVGYTLTNIKMMMEAAVRIFSKEPEKVLDILAQTRDQSDNALNETRMALRALRSMHASELTYSTINTIAKAFEAATGVVVTVEYGNLPNRIDDDIMLVLYRLIQEGMTNSFRHGRATRIMIIFGYDAGEIHVVIRDNGRGAPEITDGIGFAGMQERMSALSGKLQARNVVNGFELLASIPYKSLSYEERGDEN
jgi:signal transduction histidine kinase